MTAAVVASGRSVHLPHAMEKVCAGFNVDTREYITVPRTVVHRPGETVELPESEIARLTKLGFLVDPTDEPIPTSKTGMPA